MTTKPGFVTIPNTSYDATDWQITSPVTLTSGVKWKGGRFSGTGAAFISAGNCIGASIDSVTCDPSISWLIEGNVKPFVTYDGVNDGTFLYKNLSINNIKIGGKTILYNGTYEGPKTFHNVNFGMSITGVVKTYDQNSENILVSGHSIYKFRASDWTLIGDTKTGLVDNGVVQLNSGNGHVKNFYRRGKQDGYIGRIWGVKLGTDPDQDVIVENCVDAETVVYGTMDFRIEPGLLQTKGKIPLSGCDCYFLNNTSANKDDINNGYVSNAVVAGQTVDDLGFTYSIQIKNCIAFGAHVSDMAGSSSLLKDNSSGKAKIFLTNNIDIAPGLPVPAGIVDADYYGLTGVGAQRAVAPIPPVKQRSVLYNTFDGKTNKWTYYFDDGSIQIQ